MIGAPSNAKNSTHVPLIIFFLLFFLSRGLYDVGAEGGPVRVP